MSAETRRALANALAGASVETLRADADNHAACADLIERMYHQRGDAVDEDAMGQVAQHRRLAALALAVAAMQEALTGVQLTTDHTFARLGVSLQVWGEADIEADTIPAALAALLRAEGEP